MFADLGITTTFVDFTNIAEVKAAITPSTKMIFSETPANPTLTLNDIEALSALAQESTPPLVHVCDATFATPVMMRPIDLGADVTVHSTTKYYDGHNMTVGGVVACKTEEHHMKIKFYQNIHGNMMAPFTAFLQLQTVRIARAAHRN